MIEDECRNDGVAVDPDFQTLVRKRTRLSLQLTAAVIVLYFGFIMLVAFAPSVLGQSFLGGVMTVGIPMGVGVIVVSFMLTGVYVARANTEFDRLTTLLLERHQ